MLSVAYFLLIILNHILSKLAQVVILIFQSFLFNSMEGTFVLRFLFGLPRDLNDGDDCPEEYLKDVQQLLPILDLRMSEDDSEPFSNMKITILQVLLLYKLTVNLQLSLHCVFLLLLMPCIRCLGKGICEINAVAAAEDSRFSKGGKFTRKC